MALVQVGTLGRRDYPMRGLGKSDHSQKGRGSNLYGLSGSDHSQKGRGSNMYGLGRHEKNPGLRGLGFDWGGMFGENAPQWIDAVLCKVLGTCPRSGTTGSGQVIVVAPPATSDVKPPMSDGVQTALVVGGVAAGLGILYIVAKSMKVI